MLQDHYSFCKEIYILYPTHFAVPAQKHSLEDNAYFIDTVRQIELADLQTINSVAVQNGKQRNDTFIATPKYGETYVREITRLD